MAKDKRETDLAILRALQKDARQSNEAIGELVSKDASVVSRRIGELTKAKVITGIHAAIDPAKVGLTITSYKLVKLDDHRPPATDAFESAIAAMPEIIECARLEGSWDYLLKIQATDQRHHDKVHHALLALGMVTLARGMRAVGQPFTKPLPLDGLP